MALGEVLEILNGCKCCYHGTVSFTRANVGRVLKWCGNDVFLAKGSDVVVGLARIRFRKRSMAHMVVHQLSERLEELKHELECFICYSVDEQILVCENGHVICSPCFSHLRKRECYCSSGKFFEERLCSKRMKLQQFIEGVGMVEMSVSKRRHRSSGICGAIKSFFSRMHFGFK